MVYSFILSLFAPPTASTESLPKPSRLQSLGRLVPFHHHAPTSSFSKGSLYDIRKKTRVFIPQPLYFDPDMAVLITSDVATLRPLSTIFESICRGNSDHDFGTAERLLISGLMSSAFSRTMYFHNAGEALGKFLAMIHSPKITQQLQLSGNPPLAAHFASREQRRLAFRREIQEMRNHLQLWPEFFARSTELNHFCELLEADVARPYFPDQ